MQNRDRLGDLDVPRATEIMHPDGLSASLRAANGSSTATGGDRPLRDGDAGRETDPKAPR